MADKKISELPQGPETEALALIHSTNEVAKINVPFIREKAAKVKLFLSALKDVADDKADAWAEQALVKVGTIFNDVVDKRKQITSQFDTYKELVMQFEKEIEAEVKRVRQLRNKYANQKLADQREEQARIEKQKIYAVHEAEVKAEMKASIGYGISNKVIELENLIAGMFAKMSLDKNSAHHYQKVANSLNIKPNLKEAFIDSLLNVDYNKSIMTEEQFQALKTRAKNYPDWSHANLNAMFTEQALKIIEKWRSQIPARLKELQAIAAGGPEAESLKQKSDARLKEQEDKRKRDEEQKKKLIDKKAEEEKQEATLKAEFNAQVASQDITPLSGVRNKRTYRIDPKYDNNLAQFPNIISRMILHLLADRKYKGIYQRDAQGFPKRDDKGNAIYVEGIAYWLKEIEALGYDPKIPGLIATEEVTTIAKAKK